MISRFSGQITGPFDAELVKALPNSLAYICHNGAGYDNIDTTACSERGQSHGIFGFLLLAVAISGYRSNPTNRDTGIRVSSTPIAVNNATADITMFLMLGALRQAYVPISAIRAGKQCSATCPPAYYNQAVC